MAKAAVKRSLPDQFLNAFIGKSQPPDSKELKQVLGASFLLWSKLLAGLTADGVIDLEEWNSYSPKAGWALRLKRKGRTIVYLSPAEGRFRASFPLGERAIDAARKVVPAETAALIDAAKRYAEGTAVRIEVTRPADVAIVRMLAAIKLEN